jgi:hypothetical protein
MILLVAVSSVARIRSVSHWHPAYHSTFRLLLRQIKISLVYYPG